MSQLKVLHVIEGLGSGGAEKLLYTNLKHFGAQVESQVVMVHSGGTFWKDRIEELGMNVTTLGCDSNSRIPIALVKLFNHIRSFKPDLIHTHLWTANIIGRLAGRLAGVPVVSSIHNPEYEVAALAGGPENIARNVRIARMADKWTAKIGCTRMIAVSELVRESGSNNLEYPRDRIHLLYNPVDDPLPPTCDRDGILSDLGLEPSARVLLHVGRVSPQKGLLTAIRALPQILSVHPTAVLLSVGGFGNGEWHERVRREIDRLEVQSTVRLLGERTDVHDLLAACDVFVFPSLFEGLGIAMAEAMAAGVPCVASNIAPLNEFADPHNSILVPPDDPGEFADAVSFLLGRPDVAAELGAAAKATAHDLFQAQPAADRLVEIYRCMANRPN